jgi:hypothetical protein
MIENIAVLAFVWTAMSAVLLLKRRKTAPNQGKYIWMGEGKNPFED